MPPPEMSPEQSPELEALVLQGIEANESLESISKTGEAAILQGEETNQTLQGVEKNTEISALKLDAIDKNTKEQVAQSKKAAEDIMPSMEALGKAMTFAATLMEKLEGPQGEKGDKGDKGDKGAKGDKGDTGPQGPKGEKGEKGDRGEAGRDGVDGKAGAPGPAGRDGRDGRDGENGKDADEAIILEKTTTVVREQLAEEMSKLISENNQSVERRIAMSKTVSLKELDDVNLSGLSQNADGKYELGSGGGGTAAETSFTPAGTIAATNVQVALEELDADIQGLSVGAGISRTVVVTSGNVTAGSAAATDYVYFVSGAHTVSLPAASTNTSLYTIKNNHSANITIDTAGAELIEGAASIAIAPEESVQILSNGTNWFVV